MAERPTISALPVAPNRATDNKTNFANKANDFLPALTKLPEEINASTAYIEEVATNFELDKNFATDAKTAAQQFEQTASAASVTAVSAKQDAETALQATLEAAGNVGALILTDAKRAVKRQNMAFFKLNLL